MLKCKLKREKKMADRILIVRTDRIGDVVLSTPAITAARKAFPQAYIAMMVSPETQEIVKGNPYLNEIILYDKKARHKSFLKTFSFAMRLREKKFDLALILHSTARINLMCFLAGITRRVGYARGKMDFLLTDRLEYKKRLGEKHEAEYSLDVLRRAGINAEISPLVMTVKKKDEESVDRLLREAGLDKERFVVLHPGASDVSKMWPREKFAELADVLIDRFGVGVVFVSSAEQMKTGEEAKRLMKNKPVFLCGQTSLGELAALLKRASLFVSNDSGPVHIACAVGAPVISIFSRNEKGLSPKRWAPLGKKTRVAHKDVGCVECLAHNCKKAFLCINSVSVEEIVEKSEELLKFTL